MCCSSWVQQPLSRYSSALEREVTAHHCDQWQNDSVCQSGEVLGTADGLGWGVLLFSKQWPGFPIVCCRFYHLRHLRSWSRVSNQRTKQWQKSYGRVREQLGSDLKSLLLHFLGFKKLDSKLIHFRADERSWTLCVLNQGKPPGLPSQSTMPGALCAYPPPGTYAL